MVMEAARENGLLIGKGGMFGNVLRVTPPMNVGRTDVDQFIEVLDKSLAACSAAVATGARS
jgi:4-aminobutyrate aminotransferase-like enzyme